MPSRSLASLVAALLAGLCSPAFAVHPAVEGELIPRSALFGNPDRIDAQISPDGRYLGWFAPLDGVMNVWVAPIDQPARARALPDDKARGIGQFVWSYRDSALLYLRDSGGDENFHLYAVDLSKPGPARDLTPYPKTRASRRAANCWPSARRSPGSTRSASRC